jgi:hypothetical protein
VLWSLVIIDAKLYGENTISYSHAPDLNAVYFGIELSQLIEYEISSHTIKLRLTILTFGLLALGHRGCLSCWERMRTHTAWRFFSRKTYRSLLISLEWMDSETPRFRFFLFIFLFINHTLTEA